MHKKKARLLMKRTKEVSKRPWTALLEHDPLQIRRDEYNSQECG